MRIHKMFNGSYIDLDHVLAVSELFFDDHDIHLWAFTVVLMFREQPLCLYFDRKDMPHDILLMGDEDQLPYCQSILDDFIKTWGSKNE